MRADQFSALSHLANPEERARFAVTNQPARCRSLATGRFFHFGTAFMPRFNVSSSLFARLFVRTSVARPLLLTSALLCGAAVQAAPTGLLNDTGQTGCYNNSNSLVTCDVITTDAADANARPRQDGRFGRDAASPTKVGGGAAGFDFTPLNSAGVAIALTGSPAVPSATPTCVRDNVTNLIWEVKTTSGLRNESHTYGWGTNSGAGCGGTLFGCKANDYIAAVNALNLCGETANDWRLPTRLELLSIVHNGRTSAPTVDVNYFPNTSSTNFCWTSDTYAPDTTKAWTVDFWQGKTFAITKTDAIYNVRLVRGGP